MIGRERELEELKDVVALHSVVNERGERIYEEPAPLVIVYGGASTGKSMCVAQALHAHAETYAMVDCTAIYSAQEFYREILVQLYKNQRTASARHTKDRVRDEDGGGEGELMGQGDTHEELTIEDEEEVVSAKQRRRNGEEVDLGEKNGDADDSDDDSEEAQDGESDEEGEVDAGRGQGSKQHTIARAERIHERRKAQQQKASEAKHAHVNYEGYNSLNFLSFIKVFGNFVDSAARQEEGDASSSKLDHDGLTAAINDEKESHHEETQQQRKRVVYLALDQVDKLLDRGHAALLTCIFTINDQLAYLNVRLLLSFCCPRKDTHACVCVDVDVHRCAIRCLCNPHHARDVARV